MVFNVQIMRSKRQLRRDVPTTKAVELDYIPPTQLPVVDQEDAGAAGSKVLLLRRRDCHAHINDVAFFSGKLVQAAANGGRGRGRDGSAPCVAEHFRSQGHC